jgi:hypothetical protein
VDVPGYAAMLFRRTFMDLQQPDALVPRSHEWLSGTDAHWQGDLMQWRFPSGAVLKFGHLEHQKDVEKYQGAAAHFWGFDEAGQLDPWALEYLKSRARRPKSLKVPIRFRYSANPGGRAHEWLVENFVLGAPLNGKLFIPSKARDNPGLDVDDYEGRLAQISDEVLRAQLMDGDWNAVDRSENVVPEFTPDLKAAVVREHVRPPYFTAYVGADTGSRDLTALPFGYLDFVAGLLVIEDELCFRDPSTSEMGEAIAAKEAALWGSDVAAWRCDSVLRFCDVDWRFVKDLNQVPYRLRFVPTAKDDADMWRRQARAWLKEGKVVIHPRCTTLIRTLEHARWNERRTDYERTPETGHADFWAALVYLLRNVQWSRNPYPAAPRTTEEIRRGLRPLADVPSRAGRAVMGAFNVAKPLR